MSPLIGVEEACNMIQQEENQREIFKQSKDDSSMLVMHSKKTDLKCGNCGKTGHLTKKCWACRNCGMTRHSTEKCWSVVGYPSWFDKGKMKEQERKQSTLKEKGNFNREQRGKSGGQKWNRNKSGPRRMAGNAKIQSESTSNPVSNNLITAHQLEQLIKLLSSLSKYGNDTEEELDNTYFGMVSCNHVSATTRRWILDSGATHHMTNNKEMMKEFIEVEDSPKISLPIGETSGIKGVGKVILKNGIELKNVMWIPSFKQNLLSIHKLTRDTGCKVIIMANCCIIQDENTSDVGVGKVEKGLYYLENESLTEMLRKLKESAEGRLYEIKENHECSAMTVESELSVPNRIQGTKRMSGTELWHFRLGHAPYDRIHKIEGLQNDEGGMESGGEDDTLETECEEGAQPMNNITDHTNVDDNQQSEKESFLENRVERRSGRVHKKPQWHEDYIMGNQTD
ncbi:Retrovirus-related Pol polyprotein from transposon RE1, partial [Bienertia sinuspersici]